MEDNFCYHQLTEEERDRKMTFNAEISVNAENYARKKKRCCIILIICAVVFLVGIIMTKAAVTRPSGVMLITASLITAGVFATQFMKAKSNIVYFYQEYVLKQRPSPWFINRQCFICGERLQPYSYKVMAHGLGELNDDPLHNRVSLISCTCDECGMENRFVDYLSPYREEEIEAYFNDDVPKLNHEIWSEHPELFN